MTCSHTTRTRPSGEVQSYVSPSVGAKGFCCLPYQLAYELATKPTSAVMRLIPEPPSTASYSRCRYSKSSVMRCSVERGWLMLAGMEMRDRSLPMDCLRISHSEKDWFTGLRRRKPRARHERRVVIRPIVRGRLGHSLLVRIRPVVVAHGVTVAVAILGRARRHPRRARARADTK